MTGRAFRLLLGAVLVGADTAAAQTLAQRVAEAGEDAVTFSFAARPEACGDGERIVRIGRQSFGAWNDGDARRPCEHGPVQVRLTMHEGRVDRVESWVGTPRAREGRALGTVPAAEAARYLLHLAARSDGRMSERAVVPAVLADSAVVWPALLAIVRDTSWLGRRSRGDAAFWLSRFAGAALAGHPTSLVMEDEDEDDVKLHAVFVLSQLPHGEGIPALLDVARSKVNLGVRQRALFWLGQSGDPRAYALFESLLRS